MIKKKILFISSWYPNRLESTNGNFVQRHAEAVAKIHEVEILHAIGDSEQKLTYTFDENIINKIRTLVVYYKNTNNPILNFYRRMRAYKMGFKKMNRPDLVHANVLQYSMLFAVYLKKKYKLPFVVSEHWSGLLKINRNKISRFQLMMARYIANRADMMMPVSKMLENELRDSQIGKHFSVVGNVVDTEIFKPIINTKGEKFIFLHVSNLVPLKNADLILATAIRLRQEFQNFELHIGGDGDIAKLKKMVEENRASDYIKVFGEQSLSQVAGRMQMSNCFVLFSEYENLPCVLLESISCGVPVISTNVGGVPEIVNENVGILIDRDTNQLYNAMIKVLVHQQSFWPKTEMHQYIVDHFSKKWIAEKFDKIYRKII